MQLSGVATYQAGFPAGTTAERTAASDRESRVETPSTTESRQAGDSVTISPQARSKADEEKIKGEVEQLRRGEERVKAHEAAHKAAGGQYAGSVSYSYRSGPDGKSYIVGGEVQIDTAPEKTPQETISKMQVVIRAAMAPADPSGQDRAVAAQAAAQMAEAQQQQAAEGGEGTSARATNTGSTALQTVVPSSEGSNPLNGTGRGEKPHDGANRTYKQPPFSTYA